jgi:hypothetical protein
MKHTHLLSIIAAAFLAASCETTPVRSEFMTADIDPIEAGTITAGVKYPFSSRIRPQEVFVAYHPRTDSVVFQFPYQTVTYRQYWDPVNRETLLAAITRYHEDFAAKNLPVQGRAKMRRVYGTVEAVTEWGSSKYMMSSRGYPKVEIGYAFEKNSPYFIITQHESINELATNDDTRAVNSLRITLFFTRAMAEDLAAVLDNSHLRSLLPTPTPGAPPPGAASALPPDEY